MYDAGQRKDGVSKMDLLSMLARLLVAALLGGVVGLEREIKKRAAGLRTHLLVSLGSALVMVTAEFMLIRYQGAVNIDPTRLGAQVISGIGFLGAGTIIKQGASIKGLTTAASLWAVACVGLAVGAGHYGAALFAVAVIYGALVLLEKFEERRTGPTRINPEFTIKLANRPGKLGEVASAIGETGANITNIEVESDDENYTVVKLRLHLPKGVTREQVYILLKSIDQLLLIDDSIV
ncbi:MAG: MgtC/SapB family protein [Ruminococcaceae bacterium]|nr:MgtC/SapB family protein [Oscillospiraceae bacterium]